MNGAASVLSPATHSAEDVVRQLALIPLPEEGGWYRPTAYADLQAASHARDAPWSTIYALFTPAQFSALHRLVADELWLFHAGDPLELLQLGPSGRGHWTQLGLDPAAGQQLQAVVPAETWQGARVASGGRWSLVSCVVVPAFSWAGFTLGEAEVLQPLYPEFETAIRDLTRMRRHSPPVEA
jgi:uncharacterized protein